VGLEALCATPFHQSGEAVHQASHLMGEKGLAQIICNTFLDSDVSDDVLVIVGHQNEVGMCAVGAVADGFQKIVGRQAGHFPCAENPVDVAAGFQYPERVIRIFPFVYFVEIQFFA
jgi:hypothetical protein